MPRQEIVSPQQIKEFVAKVQIQIVVRGPHAVVDTADVVHLGVNVAHLRQLIAHVKSLKLEWELFMIALHQKE